MVFSLNFRVQKGFRKYMFQKEDSKNSRAKNDEEKHLLGASKENTSEPITILTVIRSWKMWYVSYGLITIATSYGFAIAFLAPFLDTFFHKDETTIALFFLAFGAVTAIGSPLTGVVIDKGCKLAPRIGGPLFGVVATFGYIASVTVPFMESDITAFVATLLMGGSYSIGFVMTVDDLIHLSQKLFCGDDQSKYSGARVVALSWFFLLRSLGRTAGSFINGGFFLDLLGFKGALYFHVCWLFTGLIAVCLQHLFVEEL